MITAQEAHRIGLVNEVRLPAELIPRAEAIAAKIIANAPLAVQYAMEAVNKGMEMTLSEGCIWRRCCFGVACATEDKREGLRVSGESELLRLRGNKSRTSTQGTPEGHRVSKGESTTETRSPRRRKTKRDFVVEAAPEPEPHALEGSERCGQALRDCRLPIQCIYHRETID